MFAFELEREAAKVDVRATSSCKRCGWGDELVRKMSALMVASKQMDGIRVADLESKDVEDTFAAEIASVDVVAEEQVSSRGWVAAYFQELHKVKVLTVDVTSDCHDSVSVGFLLK